MGKSQKVVIRGFISTGPLNITCSSKREAAKVLKQLRTELSDHYYYALTLAQVDSVTGEILNAGHPKGAPRRKAAVDVFVSSGGAGMTFVFNGKRYTHEYDQALSTKQNRAALQAKVAKEFGPNGWATIVPTMQSLSAHKRSQSYS